MGIVIVLLLIIAWPSIVKILKFLSMLLLTILTLIIYAFQIWPLFILRLFNQQEASKRLKCLLREDRFLRGLFLELALEDNDREFYKKIEELGKPAYTGDLRKSFRTDEQKEKEAERDRQEVSEMPRNAHWPPGWLESTEQWKKEHPKTLLKEGASGHCKEGEPKCG